MPYSPQFDTLDDDVTGEITKIQVRDQDQNPNRVLPLGANWSIFVEWTLDDDPGSAQVPALAGTWQVSAMLESIGPGYEGQAGPTMNVALTGVTKYNVTIPVVGTPPNDPVNKKAYRMVVLINYLYPNGTQGPMAGFAEGPMIQFR